MKIKINYIIYVLILLIFVFLSNYLIGYCFFTAGKSDIDHKNYKKAAANFKKAVNRDLTNPEYHYYLAESLFFLSDFDNSQKEYEKTVKLDSLSHLAKQAFEGIRKTQDILVKEQLNFTNSVNSSFSGLNDNYINNVTYNGKIVHWGQEKLPVKIYFNKSSNIQGFKSYYISSVIKAFNTWIKYLNGKLSYIIVNNPAQADIIISFVSSIKDNNNSFRDSSLGLTRHKFDKNLFKSVNMDLACLMPDSRALSKQEMYTAALHEAGHALGFMGHSYDKNDVMYPFYLNDKVFDFRSPSLRDINTVKYLYNLDADISNVPVSSRSFKKYDKNKMILGNVDSRLNKELQEAIDYINTISANSYGWVKLGDAYSNVKNYNKAISCYTRALEIDSKFNPARERLGLTYIKTGNNNAAINEYSTMIDRDPENIPLSTNLALLYLQNKQKNEANRVINSLIAMNAGAKNDKTIQKIILAIKNDRIKINITD